MTSKNHSSELSLLFCLAAFALYTWLTWHMPPDGYDPPPDWETYANE